MLLWKIISLFSAGATAYPVDLPHYDILSTTHSTYIDEDSSTFYNRSSGELGSDQYHAYNQYERQPYVANGFFGARIPNLGFGYTHDQNQNDSSSALYNGWPIFDYRFSGAFIGGFYDLEDKKFESTNFPELYDKGYDGAMSVVPQWTDFNFEVNINGTDYVLNPKYTNDTDLIDDDNYITNYTQTLNIRNGIVTTSYRWLNLIDFRFTVLAHRKYETLGLVHVELSYLANNDQDEIDLQIENFIDYDTALRTDFVDLGSDKNSDAIYMTFQPHLISSTNGTIYSRLQSDSISFDTMEITSSSNDYETNDETSSTTSTHYVGQKASLTLQAGQIYNVTKYVGISTSDHDSTFFQTAKDSALVELDFQELTIIHEQAWDELLGTSRINIPSSQLIELTADASLYHLLANQRSSSTGVLSALPVSGLSSDSYAGLQFWDTDLWMIPAVLPFAPDQAKAISKYRIYTHQQAIENARENDMPGAVYPWTSGRFGNCTSTGPCYDYEYHINVDIAYSFWKLYLQGAIDDEYMRSEAYEIFADASDFFVEYVDWNDTLSKYTTKNMTDPDEYANQVNNGAYTNVGISQLLKWSYTLGTHLGMNVSDQWLDVSQNMYLPRSESNITLEYDTMNSSIEVKQADVIMIQLMDDEDGALEQYFDYSEDDQLNDLYYYSAKQSSQGPAMTFPVFSMVSAKLGKNGCASTSYLLKSIEPFIRYPFAQISEQNYDDYDTNGGTHPAFPFLTGHGGILQSMVYGLLGVKYSYELDADSKIERKLIFDPIKLPCLPHGVGVENFQFQGVSLYIEVNDTSSVIMHHGNVNKTILIEVDSRNPDAGLYQLKAAESLHIALYETEQNVDGSIVECSSSIVDSSASEHGDVVQSIVDGDNSTTWESDGTNSTSSIVVDLGSVHYNVSNGLIVWGDNPAESFTLYSSTDLSSLTQEAILSDYPVDSLTAQSTEIKYDSSIQNRTTFSFDTIAELRYVRLELNGAYDDNGGAVIAEFNLMA